MADINITTVLTGMDQVISGLGSIGKTTEKLGDAFRNSGRNITKVGSDLSRLSAPMAAVGAAAVLAAGKFEQVSIAMETMIGSTKDAHRLLNELKDFAARTPFTFTGIADASKMLMAMGFEAKAVIPIMTTVGNATSALGTGQEGINRIIYALGQMRSAATLNSQDMRQLQQAFINGWEYIAKATGKSIAEVRDLTAKGMMDARDAVRIILEGMANDPRFRQMMDTQSRTLLGVWSNFMDQLGFILIDMGNDIAKALDLKGVTESLIASMKNMLRWWTSLSTSTKEWVVHIGLAVAAAGPLLIVFGQLSIGMGAVLKVLGLFIGLLGSPILLAMGAVVAGMAYLITISDNWGTVIAGIGALFRSLWTTITTVTEGAGIALSRMVEAVELAIKGRFKEAWKTLQDGEADIKKKYLELPDKIKKTWTVDFDATKRVVDRFTKDAAGSIRELTREFKNNDETVDAARYSYNNLEEALAQMGGGAEDASAKSRILNAELEALGFTTSDLTERYDILGDAASYIPEVMGRTEKQGGTLQKLYEDLGNSMLNWVDIARSTYGSITSGFGRAISDMIVRGKNWHDAISGFFTNVLANFVAMVAEMTAQWVLLNYVLNVAAPFGGGLLNVGAGVAAGGGGGAIGGSILAAGAGGNLFQGVQAGWYGGFETAGAIAGNAGSGFAMTAGGYLGAAAPWILGGLAADALYNNVPIIKNTVKGVGSAISDAGSAIGDFFGWARGGETMVTQPTMFMAGEHGPEAVSVTPMGGNRGRGAGVNINLQGPAIFDDITMARFAKTVSRELNKWR